mmetsp:Transcript_626/g.2536  ORF Transcript_626/g.2536 Transcript_626/m.2536 type:complete len:256 (+) Transcript_626:4949-5716(+)
MSASASRMSSRRSTRRAFTSPSPSGRAGGRELRQRRRRRASAAVDTVGSPWRRHSRTSGTISAAVPSAFQAAWAPAMRYSAPRHAAVSLAGRESPALAPAAARPRRALRACPNLPLPVSLAMPSGSTQALNTSAARIRPESLPPAPVMTARPADSRCASMNRSTTGSSSPGPAGWGGAMAWARPEEGIAPAAAAADAPRELPRAVWAGPVTRRGGCTMASAALMGTGSATASGWPPETRRQSMSPATRPSRRGEM